MLFNPNLPCLCLYSISKLKSAMFRKHDSFYWMMQSHPSKHSSWWRRLDQDEYVCLSLRSSEDVFKTSWTRPIYSSWLYVFKTSCQDVFKTFWRRLQNVFKTSWKTSSRHLQDVFKTFWRRLQNIFKTSSRRLQDVSSS